MVTILRPPGYRPSTAVMDWTWLQQMAPRNFIKIDIFNPQTVGTGRNRYTSHELQTQHVTSHHHITYPALKDSYNIWSPTLYTKKTQRIF